MADEILLPTTWLKPKTNRKEASANTLKAKVWYAHGVTEPCNSVSES